MMTAIDDDGLGGATRHDGWTLARQLGFLEALAETGSVTRAAAAVGMSASSAYRLRGRSEGDIFAYGWRAAQEMAYYRLRDIALDRIEHGVATPSVHKGEVVATKTVFSDRLLVAMLTHLKPAAGARGATGLRAPAADPGHDFAATVAAYHDGIDRGVAPKVPANARDGCVNGCSRTPVMTRAEFLAAIEARPLPPARADYDDAGATFA